MVCLIIGKLSAISYQIMPIAHTTHSNQTPHLPISPSLKKVVPGWWAVADHIFTALANSLACHCPPYDYPDSRFPIPDSRFPIPHVTKRKKKPIDTGRANSIS
ncbi:hypothetical protein [Moorena producens]|uniref:hypothetical protein n=1 Tax=Moorena producens TaxID=1155739 RepID=UPI003C75B734